MLTWLPLHFDCDFNMVNQFIPKRLLCDSFLGTNKKGNYIIMTKWEGKAQIKQGDDEVEVRMYRLSCLIKKDKQDFQCFSLLSFLLTD